MLDSDTLELYRRVQEKDEAAATELFHRYLERLLAIVRVRLSAKLARRIDPEDVLQSAYRSFFAGATDGRFELNRSGDLWNLLAAITLNKLHRQIEHHRASRRNFVAENGATGRGLFLYPLPAEALAKDPAPEEAISLIEEVQSVMLDLKRDQREILEMRLQGSPISEIAQLKNCSERTVRRVLGKIKDRLKYRLFDLTT
jgi:RNA polymerase sigma factor (sigma-70 family)